MVKRLLGVLSFMLFHTALYAAENNPVSFETLLKTGKSWDGKELEAYPGGSPEVTILKVKVPPGAVVDKHKHPVMSAAVIISGEITVVSEHGDRVTFKAGDAVVELVDTVHYGTNTGLVDTELLVFYAGVKGMPLSIKE